MNNMFDKAVAFVLEHEGGAAITDDPNDPGGLTKYGISQRSFPDLDIRALSEGEAVMIYKVRYWDKCRCSELPGDLAIIVFDAAVNQGPMAAAKTLQQALGVNVDGIIGPATIAAACRAGRSALSELVARRMVMYGLNPNFTRYGLGWSRRLSACHELAMEA